MAMEDTMGKYGRQIISREHTIIQSDIYVRSAVGNELPMRLYFKIYDQQIRPILEYASKIWCQ